MSSVPGLEVSADEPAHEHVVSDASQPLAHTATHHREAYQMLLAPCGQPSVFFLGAIWPAHNGDEHGGIHRLESRLRQTMEAQRCARHAACKAV